MTYGVEIAPLRTHSLFFSKLHVRKASVANCMEMYGDLVQWKLAAQDWEVGRFLDFFRLPYSM